MQNCMYLYVEGTVTTLYLTKLENSGLTKYYIVLTCK